MTGMIEVAPGDLGTPPNRQSGPVAAYMLEGEIIFELEGEPERVIKAGDAFWEPGGDVIHYQSANNLQDSWSRYLIVMMCVPGQPMLTLADEEDSPPASSSGSSPCVAAVPAGGGILLVLPSPSFMPGAAQPFTWLVPHPPDHWKRVRRRAGRLSDDVRRAIGAWQRVALGRH